MSETIKLNEGIEGAEVRDALKWVKRITEDEINKMKIGRKGFLFSFINDTHTIAGKVFIPSTGELWKSEKEVGFNCERLYNAFSIFKKRDKTELYINENRLFLKNGALKWRYEMEEVEQAQKIDFSKIPTPSIKISIKDILPFKSINKGRRAVDKKEIIGFKYGNGKAALFVADKNGKDRIDLGEVATEGEGDGIALYNLVLLEKLLKDAKSGFMRIGEDKPAKLNVYTGKATKAVLYLAPLLNSDLTEEIRGEGVPSPGTSPTESGKEQKEEEVTEEVTVKEEGGISIGTRVFYTGDMANVEGWGTISKIINDEFGLRYDINMTDGRVWHSLHLVMFEKSVGQRFKLEEQVVKERLDKIQEQEMRVQDEKTKEEETSEEVEELKNDIKTDEETLEKVEKEEENREPEAGEEEIFNADAPRLEEDIKQVKAELDRIQEQEKIEQEKAKQEKKVKMFKLTKREAALEVIRIEWAMNGKDTLTSTRAYIENRIGREARDKAAIAGLKQFEQGHKEVEEDDDDDTFTENLARARKERAAMTPEERKEAEAEAIKEYEERRQRVEKAEQEKKRGFREAVYKREIVSVCFFNYLEGTKDTIYRDAEGYEYQSNALNFDTFEIKKIKELKRIDKAATAAAEQVEREKTEEAFKEAEQTVKEWKDSFKGDEVREEVIKEGVSFLTVREANGTAFHNSKEVYEDMKAEAQIDRECMWVLHLVGGKVLKKELVAMGKGNAAYTTPREVYRRAIIEGTTKIIMVHNHPSGDPTPSDSDISTCENYVKAGELLGIGLLDFLVIGTQGYTSFADKGLGGF